MIERSKNGKAIYVKAGLWIRPDGSVSIAHPKKPRFHVRVTNNSKLNAVGELHQSGVKPQVPED
jgi:hypothetical protein